MASGQLLDPDCTGQNPLTSFAATVGQRSHLRERHNYGEGSSTSALGPQTSFDMSTLLHQLELREPPNWVDEYHSGQAEHHQQRHTARPQHSDYSSSHHFNTAWSSLSTEASWLSEYPVRHDHQLATEMALEDVWFDAPDKVNAELEEEWLSAVIEEGGAGRQDIITDVFDNSVPVGGEQAAELARMQSWWKNTTTETDWLAEFEKHLEYQPREENAFAEVDDPFQEGRRCLQLGDIPNAALCFEAAVARDPDNFEAWRLLGATQAENEQDSAAISALQKALSLNPGDSSSLMTLATCYTNESKANLALHCLWLWLRSDDPEPTARDQWLYSYDKAYCAEVEQCMLSAVEGSAVNADLQCGLGVLYSIKEEYDRAADCFRAAVSVHPEEPLLWNRLGATLANGGHSAEAVAAYRRALNIAPGYVRCRYNLGIACCNLSSQAEGARHFVTVLRSQKESRTSGNVWSSLRMALLSLSRRDLYDLALKEDLDGVEAGLSGSPVS